MCKTLTTVVGSSPWEIRSSIFTRYKLWKSWPVSRHKKCAAHVQTLPYLVSWETPRIDYNVFSIFSWSQGRASALLKCILQYIHKGKIQKYILEKSPSQPWSPDTQFPSPDWDQGAQTQNLYETTFKATNSFERMWHRRWNWFSIQNLVFWFQKSGPEKYS